MPREKNACAYCGNHRFGLIRHFVGFKHFCTRLCKERFLERRAREMAEYRNWLDRVSHNRAVLKYRYARK